MIVTISSADAVRVTAGEPFVVDGDWHVMLSYGPASPWDELDKPCATCCGSGLDGRELPGRADLYPPEGCPDCHGTRRTVVELVLTHENHTMRSLGLFTVEVLPIETTEQFNPDKAGIIYHGPDRAWRNTPPDDWAMPVTLPPDAKPGQYAVIATKVGGDRQ